MMGIMKKALMPILIIVAVVALLLLLARWYEEKYGMSGPFRSSHEHGHSDEEEVVHPPRGNK